MIQTWDGEMETCTGMTSLLYIISDQADVNQVTEEIDTFLCRERCGPPLSLALLVFTDDGEAPEGDDLVTRLQLDQRKSAGQIEEYNICYSFKYVYNSPQPSLQVHAYYSHFT